MADTSVRVEQRGAVLEVTLDRPKANAINRATSRLMSHAFVRLRDDPTLRVGIVTGAGDRIFSAGWDLKAAAAGTEDDRVPYDFPGGFAGLTEFFDLDKPVIAAVNGSAVGGGFELALACDIIVAAEHAAFWLPEARLGNMADAGGVQRLPRRLPYHVAMDLLLTGRKLTAQEAKHFGLVREIVPKDQPMTAARAIADQLAAAAPLSVQAIKEMVRGIEGLSLPAAFDAMKAGRFPGYRRMLESADHVEGPRAFAEGREPDFKGC